MKRIDALRGMIAWLVLLPLGAAAWAQDVGEGVRVEQVLTAGQIDSNTVDVGAFVVVVYGQGERHPVSEAWTQLDTARGSIKAVDSRRLIVGLAPDGWSKWIALERIQTLSLLGAPLSAADRDHTHTRTTKRIQPAQAEPEVARSDSLSEQREAMVKRYYKKADNREDAGLRVLKKMAVGTLSGIVFTGMAVGVQDKIWESKGDPDIGFLLNGSLWGSWVGFPFGVSSVDPYDSLPTTLFAGVIPPVLAGYSLAIAGQEMADIGLTVMYIGPIIGSLYASEKWRKPPQARRVSLSLFPTPNGGLSAVTTLRF